MSENHRILGFESNDFIMNIGGILRFHMLDSRISSIWLESDPSMMITHHFIQKYFFDFLVLHCYLYVNLT